MELECMALEKVHLQAKLQRWQKKCELKEQKMEKSQLCEQEMQLQAGELRQEEEQSSLQNTAQGSKKKNMVPEKCQ